MYLGVNPGILIPIFAKSRDSNANPAAQLLQIGWENQSIEFFSPIHILLNCACNIEIHLMR
jgi:hypothetical protein